jgi:hypothetical protein
MKAIEIGSTVGEMPAECDHCGGETESIGLVAPKCVDCGRFSLSHISFGPPKEVDVDIKIVVGE